MSSRNTAGSAAVAAVRRVIAVPSRVCAFGRV